MLKVCLYGTLVLVGFAAVSGCDSGASTAVVAPPSDEAAKAAQIAAEEAYTAEMNAAQK